MVFTGRLKLGVSILIVIIISLVLFSGHSLWIFESPIFYIVSCLLIIMPVIYNKTKRVMITEDFIEVKSLFGIINEKYPWTDIEEAHFVNTRKTTNLNYKNITPLVDLFISETYQLIISEKEPITIQSGDFLNGKEIYNELQKHVKFIKPSLH